MMHEPYSPDHLNGCLCRVCVWRGGFMRKAEIANRVFLDWLKQARRQPK